MPRMKRTKQASRFYELLLDYSRSEDPEKRKSLEQKLWTDYGRRVAVLCLDMSGFSELALRHGIVHYLSMVRRMQLTAKPIVESHEGIVVKFVADNCFAVFEEVAASIRASIALNLAFDGGNIHTPDQLDISVSCGIDYGDVLLVGAEDLFGNPVNRASKLGEDLAGPGEILVTADAMERVPAQADLSGKPLNLSISGIELEAWSIGYRLDQLSQ